MRLARLLGDDGVERMQVVPDEPTLIVKVVAHRRGSGDEEAGGPVARTARTKSLGGYLAWTMMEPPLIGVVPASASIPRALS